ncbi:hypothetical protein BD309DRAFT_968577 [Dichomitus squalens]|nr:hypothetical protein BD309DRAFT_968577 [Dichomitus squalens]
MILRLKITLSILTLLQLCPGNPKTSLRMSRVLRRVRAGLRTPQLPHFSVRCNDRPSPLGPNVGLDVCPRYSVDLT